jgi:outer membrane lipoprotein-sorting protein
MRWEQTIPKQYVMVMAGDLLKIREDGKVTEHALSSNKLMRGMKEIMVGSITGNLLNSDQFETSIFESEKNYVVKLIPIPARMKKMFEKVKMTFDRKTYRMQTVVLTEPGGDYTEIEFSNAEFNKKLDATLFDLK